VSLTIASPSTSMSRTARSERLRRARASSSASAVSPGAAAQGAGQPRFGGAVACVSGVVPGLRNPVSLVGGVVAQACDAVAPGSRLDA